jgi:hypothetical protein
MGTGLRLACNKLDAERFQSGAGYDGEEFELIVDRVGVGSGLNRLAQA